LAIDKLTNKRVAVLENIKAELIKFWKMLFLDTPLQFEHKMSTTEKIPDLWEEEIICSGHKKADPLESRHYRDITLLYTANEVFTKVLCNK
jgi:hypothetical protein